MGPTADSIENGNAGLALSDSDSKFTKKAGLVLIGVTALTAVSAGLVTARLANKRGERFLKEFAKEMKASPTPPAGVIMENPYILAFKALGWGTVWAVGGVSLISVGICSWFGIRSLDDLRTKIRQARGPVDTSTNFETFQELLNYLDKESKRPKSNSTDSEVKS